VAPIDYSLYDLWKHSQLRQQFGRAEQAAGEHSEGFLKAGDVVPLRVQPSQESRDRLFALLRLIDRDR
jgi:hypothetical protein